jgi:hypothetical protein
VRIKTVLKTKQKNSNFVSFGILQLFQIMVSLSSLISYLAFVGYVCNLTSAKTLNYIFDFKVLIFLHTYFFIQIFNHDLFVKVKLVVYCIQFFQFCFGTLGC